MWELGPDPSEVQFNCTWPGAYPTPMLRWVEIHDGPDTQAKDHLYVSDQADSLVVSLNRTGLFNGQTLKCIAEHPALQQEEHKSCLLNLSELAGLSCFVFVIAVRFDFTQQGGLAAKCSTKILRGFLKARKCKRCDREMNVMDPVGYVVYN